MPYNNQKKVPATSVTYNGKTVDLLSTITCPKCGHQKEEIMPTNACQYFYECENCKQVLTPKQGDCCVYCSYGSVKCPPIQAGVVAVNNANYHWNPIVYRYLTR